MKPRAECPWCHAAVDDLRAPCPKCGKLASDLRTTDPPDASAEARAAALAIPDLVIPTAKRAPQAKPSVKPVDFDDELGAGGDLQIDLSNAAPAKPGIARPPTPGVGFSPFDDDISAGPSLELDTAGGLPPRVSAPSPPISQPFPAPPTSQRSLAPEPPGSAPGSPQSPDARAAAIDPYEARVLADYGPKPEAFWHTPLYAYRVMMRRAALRRDLLTRRDEAERTHKRVEDALVAFGERARGIVKPGSPALERVTQAEELLRSRDGALAKAMDARTGAISEIDTRLAAAEVELGRTREELARLEGLREAADEDWKRADAKVKRLEIEIRNGATSRASERDALATEAAQKNAKRADAEQKVAEARRVTNTAQAKTDAIAAERAAHEARFSRQSGTRSAGVDDAQRHLRAALVELGRAMLSDPSATHLAHARDELVRLEEQAHKNTSDVALHEKAITAYDAPQVFIGMVLVGIALLLVLVLVLFPFIYRAVAT